MSVGIKDVAGYLPEKREGSPNVLYVSPKLSLERWFSTAGGV